MAISAIRNGLPVCITFQNARKSFVCKNTCHPDILANAIQIKEIYTNIFATFYNLAKINLDAIDLSAINLCKIAELEPILIEIEENEELISASVTSGEIESFIKNDLYDIKYIADAPLKLKNAADATIYAFNSVFGGHEHYALIVGKPDMSCPIVRIHSSCYTGDLLASLRCDCRDQLQDAITTMAQNNGGIVLYLMQEGRGIGLASKIKAYALQQGDKKLDTVESNYALGFDDDERIFMPAKKMLDYFGVSQITLMTNNPHKASSIEDLGIKIAGTTKTIFAINQYNSEYLEIKKEKMGHGYSQ